MYKNKALKHSLVVLLSSFFLSFSSAFVNSLSAQTVQQVVIGNTTGIGSWNYGPIFRNTGNLGMLNNSRHAYLYTAADLGIPSGVKIVSLEWLKKDTGKVTGNNNTFNVFINNTSATSLTNPSSWSSLTNGALQAFGSTTFSVTGGANTYVKADFTDTFTYSGAGLQIMVDWEKMGYATGSFQFYMNPSTGKALGIPSIAPMNSSVNLQSATYGNARPTLRITYVTVPPCVGTPAPGNTLATVSNICTGIPFTLTLQNNIPGGLVTYQWQSSDNAAFTSGVLNLGIGSTQTTTQIANKYYRAIVTCGNGSLVGTTTPLLMPMSPSYGCYCMSGALSEADEDIFKFSFGSVQNCSDCSSIAAGQYSIPNRYSNYQYLNPSISQVGASIPFSIQIGDCGIFPHSSRCAIFIDFNHNTSFSDPGEMVYSSAAPTNGPHVESGFINIPTTSLTGLTGMRVMNVEQTAPFSDPCLIYPWGETEDYVVNILPASPCSGMPTPGSTVINLDGTCTPASGTYALCSGKTTKVTIQSITSGTGVTYQWYNNGISIPGATSSIYTTPALTAAQSYYAAVTCSGSGLTSNSTPINIIMNSFLNCYCTSTAAGPADEDIMSFSLNGATNTSDCLTPAPGQGSVISQYSNFTTLGNFTNITLGTSVPFSLTQDDCDVPPTPYFSFSTAIWVDFNHNGSFNDAGEKVFVEQVALAGPRTITGNIAVPCTAREGQTRMRVAIVEGLSGSQITPCMTYGFGETEDYLINLIQPTTNCSILIPSPGATQASTTHLCDSSTVNLSLSNNCLLGNYSYQWFKNGLPISGATNYTYTTPKMFSTSIYYASVSCGVATLLSVPVTITTSTISNVSLNSSSPTFCATGGIPVSLTALASGGTLIYTWTPNATLVPSTGPLVTATPTATTTYTVTATDILGCARTSTATIQFTTCSSSINLKLFLQGYYDGSGLMKAVLLNQGVGSNPNITDSIDVELRFPTTPYVVATTKRVALLTNGTATVSLPSLTGSYYIVVKHRNGLTTWSAIAVPASGTYDFTTAANKAFGNNLIQLEPGIWAIYSGDVTNDDNTDLLDMSLIENAITVFASGYVSSDINGDGNVDLLDTPEIEVNISNFIFSLHP